MDAVVFSKLLELVGKKDDARSTTGTAHAKLAELIYDLGLRTDAANPAGSLHAKTTDIKNAVNSIAGKNIINHGSAIKSIQRGTIQLSTSETSKTATISSVSTSKTMLNFLGARAYSDERIFDDPYLDVRLAVALTGHHFVTLQLTSSTQITVTRAESNNMNITVSYEVIEYY